ncbi:MAG: glycosyltransferase family 39 protein, partial [Firmicutes bacterium]|nr:glycosyltransferase family 39 protein [Bacillota bacterium]
MEPLLYAGIFGTFYAGLGVWLALHNFILGDALSRVANAFYVLFSRDPHLEAIGFVWNPLPSFLEFPLVALHFLWPPLATQGVSANLISAAFGSVMLYYAARLLIQFSLPRWVRLLALISLGTNPVLAFYASNGMTEVMMIATLLGSLFNLCAYIDSRDLRALVFSSLWLAMGFLIRYEVVIWAVVETVILITVQLPVVKKNAADKKLQRLISPMYSQEEQTAGILLLWLSPLGYVATCWAFWNWSTMGDPLYFMNSIYGNAAQLKTVTAQSGIQQTLQGNWVRSFVYVANEVRLYPVVLLGFAFTLISLFSLKARTRLFGALLLGSAAAIPVLQIGLLYKGASAGWMRYFISYIPFGFLMVTYSLSLL